MENIFQVEVDAGPSYNEIKKLPNKVLLWCGKKHKKNHNYLGT